jgi:hypothetical protein
MSFLRRQEPIATVLIVVRFIEPAALIVHELRRNGAGCARDRILPPILSAF